MRFGVRRVDLHLTETLSRFITRVLDVFDSLLVVNKKARQKTSQIVERVDPEVVQAENNITFALSTYKSEIPAR